MEALIRNAKEQIASLDRNSRITDCENSIKFLEAKVLRIEKVLKSIPSNYVVPKQAKVLLEKEVCKRCQSIDKHYEGLVESNKKKIANIQAAQEKDNFENRFLLKRIVCGLRQ